MQSAMLTSWDDRCGIADYSRHLVAALRRQVEVEIVPATFLRSQRAVYAAMGTALNVAEVAHVQHSYALFGGMHPLHSGWGALASSVRRPLVVTVHELDQRPTGAYHLPAAAEVAYKRRFNRSVFLHPAVRWWVTHAVQLRIDLLGLGVPEERITCRPLPIAAPPEPLPDAAAARAALGLSGRRPLAILGFLARRKGYDTALAALARLPSEYVLVAAGGEHAADRTGTEAWLREEARRAGLGERLVVTGYLPDEKLEQVVAAAELVLAPFHEMSASASLGFALARRKTVVASDLPENRALGCVRLIPTGDAAALSQAVLELVGSPSARRDLEEAAGRYAAEHTYAALADETVRIYARLIDEGRP